MANPIRITEADLRSAMREPRYWQNGHPEREAFTGWVRGGFGALHPKDAAARGAVWVRPYRREGKPVAGHWRSPPPGGTAADPGALPPGTIQYANWRRSLWERLTRGPADGRGGQGRRPNNDDRRRQRPTPPPRAAPEDEVGQRIDRLLRDRLTTPDPEKPVLKKGEFQWRRDGGPSLRERDITDLRPTEMRRDRSDEDVRIYRLDENRQMIVRPSTTEKNNPLPTIEVQQWTRQPDGSSEWISIHKIRYRLND